MARGVANLRRWRGLGFGAGDGIDGVVGGASTGGVVSAAAAQRDFKVRDLLAEMPDGFWGVADLGNGGKYSGIRCGAGNRDEGVPEEAMTQTCNIPCHLSKRVFLAGDRVGLLVDMDARTLTILRNGEPIPSLVFTDLPAQVYLAATLVNGDASVRFVADGE